VCAPGWWGADAIRSIEYRRAEDQIERLPALAADLAGRQVSLILATSRPDSALAAKSVTTSIPIVFSNAADPVQLGLVASLNRPGGNVTGVTTVSAELEAKRLGLLRELVPSATSIAVLVNPTRPGREFAAGGGLMSYGPGFGESYHQAGILAGRILRGEKPADLPVMQPTKFELVINMKTAKALGIEVPISMQMLADEVAVRQLPGRSRRGRSSR
jgi:ABC-type uncharacterized transport system substrate-binding protein